MCLFHIRKLFIIVHIFSCVHEANRFRYFIKNDILFVTLAVIACSVVLYRLSIQLPVGPGWDAYSFLLNALTLSGESFAYFEYDRYPLFPFMISIAFRLGHVDTSIAMYLDAFFAIVGSLLLYVLVRVRYNQVLALLAGLLFITAPIMINWVSMGYADIGSVTFSIASIYAFVRGIDHSPKWCVIAWPLLMCAFLMRNTAALIVIPIAYYYIMNEKISIHQFHLTGIGICAILFIPIMRFYASRTGDPFFLINFVFYGFSKSADTTGSVGEIYSLSRYYFINNISGNLIYGDYFYIFVFMALFGLVVLISSYMVANNLTFTEFIFIISLGVLFIVVFVYGSFLGILLALMLIMLLIYSYTKKTSNGIFFGMMIIWMLSYLAFHSLYYQKVGRYYLTMLPGFAYILALFIDNATRKIGTILRYKGIGRTITVLLIVILISVSSYNTIIYRDTDDEREVHTANILAAEYLKPVISEKPLIYSDYWVALGWMMQYPVYSMPLFSNNTAYGHELHKYRVDFYASYHNWDIEGYSNMPIAKGYYVYTRQFRIDKADGLNIGSGWHNYFEYLTNYSFYLHDGAYHIKTGSDYIDDYSLEELNDYKFITLFDFKWHDKKTAETLISLYVLGGGIVIIDCSGNSSNNYHSLSNNIFLGMNILRDEIKQNNNLEVHIDLGDIELATLEVDNTRWYGVTYKPVRNDPEIYTTLATIDDKMLIVREERDAGVILWIGYNLLFHASVYDDEGEKSVINKVISDIVLS